ncbi:hypothetical protein A2U01_0100610, partial [Trifolium medium]|nr:hypothetical protein [Trifolium medium]
MGCPTWPIKGTIGPAMGVYISSHSQESNVLNSSYSLTLCISVLSSDLSIRMPAGTTPPPVDVAAYDD